MAGHSSAAALVMGVIFWYFLSCLRFAKDMSLLPGAAPIGHSIGAGRFAPAPAAAAFHELRR